MSPSSKVGTLCFGLSFLYSGVVVLLNWRPKSSRRIFHADLFECE